MTPRRKETLDLIAAEAQTIVDATLVSPPKR
jgi:hypothetical protein